MAPSPASAHRNLQLSPRLPADGFLEEELGGYGVDIAYLIEQGADTAIVTDPILRSTSSTPSAS
jgi:hypothetical protein